MNYIDQFFLELDKRIKHPIRVILTGAMAGIVLGNIRPSMDIDFEIEFSSIDTISEDLKSEIETAIKETAKKVSLPAEYTESIQGWSQISFLNYRETSTIYKKIGKIEVRILSAQHWSIGKMARYLELDEMDLVYVIKKCGLKWEELTMLWGEALKNSVRSDKSREFRDHVIDFLKSKGKAIWGETFDAESAMTSFKQAAGIH